jgi:hypothetical protein
MPAGSRKRQRTDPSPVKSTQTLFHFFSKPNGTNAAFKSEASSPKTESDTSSLNDEYRRKSDLGAFLPRLKTENTPSRIPVDEIQHTTEVKETKFDASFTEQNDTCSPTKEDTDEIDPFDGMELPYQEPQDEDFRDEEMDYIDDIEDDYDDTRPIKSEPLDPPFAINQTTTSAVKSESPDPSVDSGPSCPFCNFSFKGLTEDVPPPQSSSTLSSLTP